MPPGGSKKVRSSINSRSSYPLVRLDRVDDDVAQSRTGGDGDLQFVGASLGRFGLGDQLVERADPRLTLALASPRREADPLELSLRGGLARLVGFLFGGESVLLLLQPRGVVALPGNTVPAIEFKNPLRRVVKEVAVVGDRDDGAAVVLEGALEPGHRFGVEVVRRLVEQQQVGLGQQQPTQGDATALAARQAW